MGEPADESGLESRPDVGVVLSTFAIALFPEYDEAIRQALHARAPGGRLLVLGFKQPGHAPSWLVDLGVVLTRSFVATRDRRDARPVAAL